MGLVLVFLLVSFWLGLAQTQLGPNDFRLFWPLVSDSTCVKTNYHSVALDCQGQLTANASYSGVGIDFPGDGARMDVPYSPSLNSPSFTVLLWMRVKGGVGTIRSPLTNRDQFRGWMFYCHQNELIAAQYGDSQQWYSLEGQNDKRNCTLNTWFHLALSYNQDTAESKFYINGTFQSSNVATLSPNRQYSFRVGGGSTESVNGGNWMVGTVASVVYYNRVCDQAEIQNDMQSTTPGALQPPFAPASLSSSSGLASSSSAGFSSSTGVLSSSDFRLFWPLINDSTCLKTNYHSVALDCQGQLSGASYSGVGIDFPGGGARMDVPYSPSLNTPSFTAQLWMRVSGGVGTIRSPLTNRGVFKGWMFYCHQTEVIAAQYGDSQKWYSLEGQNDKRYCTLNTWFHLALSYNQDTAESKFYINGTFQSSNVATLSPNNQFAFRVGGGSTESVNGNNWMVGTVASVVYYNRVCDQAQIQNDMQSTTPGPGALQPFVSAGFFSSSTGAPASSSAASFFSSSGLAASSSAQLSSSKKAQSSSSARRSSSSGPGLSSSARLSSSSKRVISSSARRHAASCEDGFQNGLETDTDCGGGICGTCDPGRLCKVASDCVSAVCSYFVCTDVDSTTKDSGGSTLSSGAVAGLLILVLVVVLAILCCGIRLYRKRRQGIQYVAARPPPAEWPLPLPRGNSNRGSGLYLAPGPPGGAPPSFNEAMNAPSAPVANPHPPPAYNPHAEDARARLF